jgi:hypothetical protein
MIFEDSKMSYYIHMSEIKEIKVSLHGVLLLFLLCTSPLFSVIISNLIEVYPVYAEKSPIIFQFSATTTLNGRELAVAFHSATFIDAQADPLAQIEFGTSEANNLQGEGWYENEQYSGVGGF